MVTKTDTEQLRADFEAWAKADGYEDFERFGEGYAHPELREAWRGYQAGRAALQSRDRGRLQYIADDGCAFDTLIQPDGSCKYRLMWPNYEDWEYQTAWFDSPADAIDHARRIEEIV